MLWRYSAGNRPPRAGVELAIRAPESECSAARGLAGSVCRLSDLREWAGEWRRQRGAWDARVSRVLLLAEAGRRAPMCYARCQHA